MDDLSATETGEEAKTTVSSLKFQNLNKLGTNILRERSVVRVG